MVVRLQPSYGMVSQLYEMYLVLKLSEITYFVDDRIALLKVKENMF